MGHPGVDHSRGRAENRASLVGAHGWRLEVLKAGQETQPPCIFQHCLRIKALRFQCRTKPITPAPLTFPRNGRALFQIAQGQKFWHKEGRGKFYPSLTPCRVQSPPKLENLREWPLKENNWVYVLLAPWDKDRGPLLRVIWGALAKVAPVSPPAMEAITTILWFSKAA